MRIALFLEDNGHELFLKALIQRISSEFRVHTEFSVLNSPGGAPRRDEALERFLRDYTRTSAPEFDIAVVAADTDCKGMQAVQQQLQSRVDQAGYPGRVVFAIPEPHIECWYLADPHALQRVLQSPVLPPTPDSRCGRNRFKRQLSDAIRQGGKTSLLGGVEYADAIVGEMDLYRAGVEVPSLGKFIEDLRTAMQEFSKG